MVEDFEGITDKLKDTKGGHDNPDVFPVLLNLGKHCTERLPKKRPEMVEVLKSLEAAQPHATSSIRKFLVWQIFDSIQNVPYFRFRNNFYPRDRAAIFIRASNVPSWLAWDTSAHKLFDK